VKFEFYTPAEIKYPSLLPRLFPFYSISYNLNLLCLSIAICFPFYSDCNSLIDVLSYVDKNRSRNISRFILECKTQNTVKFVVCQGETLLMHVYADENTDF
jgi:hypothetical protein